MKVTAASESEPEVRSALRWMDRAEVEPGSELASSRMRGESDSVHSAELGRSEIHDHMSIVSVFGR